jgi:hypothetical protein
MERAGIEPATSGLRLGDRASTNALESSASRARSLPHSFYY